jgi:glycerophosphoryl diester phosphodiesterase
MSDILSWIRLSGPFLIGHRGYPAAARENTPLSFEAALEAGCDGVEMDVRMTGDGELVVHHDETVNGAGGPAVLERMEWSRLEGRSFRAPEGPYRVFRFAEVLEALNGRCLLNVEVKPPVGGRHGSVADRLLEALDTVRPRESVLVSSFDAEALAAVRRRDASVLLAFLFKSLTDFNHLEEEEIAEDLAALHPRHDLVDRKLMKRAGERGLLVNAWTVDDPAEASRLVGLGAAGVVTNLPERIADAVYGDVPPE